MRLIILLLACVVGVLGYRMPPPSGRYVYHNSHYPWYYPHYYPGYNECKCDSKGDGDDDDKDSKGDGKDSKGDGKGSKEDCKGSKEECKGSKEKGSKEDDDCKERDPERRIYSFGMVEQDRRPGNFVNEDGELDGFDMDIVKGVCHMAERDCVLTAQPPSACARTIDGKWYAGEGILGGWFDACPRWLFTQERNRAVDYTTGYKKTWTSAFYTLPGNPALIDGTNLDQTGNTIALVSGFVSNQNCLKRLGYSGYTEVMAPTIPQALDMLRDGDVDAYFSSMPQIEGFERQESGQGCGGDMSIIVKKGNPLVKWWDEAFEKFVNCGCYDELCDKWGALSVVCLELTPDEDECKMEDVRRGCSPEDPKP